MALDPRIALAIKSPTLDLSGVVNAVRDRRNFDALQEQNKITNEQNAQKLAMQQEMQDANLANIQSQIGVRQAAEERAQQGFDIKKQQLDQAQIQQLAQDNAIKAKNALDAGNIDLAKDLFAQTSNAIANSSIDENIKQSALSETNSLLLGLNTGKEDMVKQQLGQAINATQKPKTIKSTERVKGGTNIIYSDGSQEFKPFAEGIQRVDTSGQTPEEKQRMALEQLEKEKELEIKATGEKEREKFRSKKIEEEIDVARDFSFRANEIPELQSKLDGLRTGGGAQAFDKTLAFFGVTTEDGLSRAEATRRVGLDMISQLKSVFGAQFAASETELFKDINGAIENKSSEQLIAILDQQISDGLTQMTNTFDKMDESTKQEVLSNLNFTEKQFNRVANTKNRKERVQLFKDIIEDNNEIRKNSNINQQNVDVTQLSGQALIDYYANQ